MAQPLPLVQLSEWRNRGPRIVVGRKAGDPYLHLAVEVILRAMKDAQSGDPEAQAWLATTGYDWVEMLGVDGDVVLRGGGI